MRQTWNAVLISAQVAGANLTASNTATSLLPAQAKYTLPNCFLNDVGQELRISGMFQMSNIVTTPGTFTLDVRFGATIVFNSGAIQMSTTAHTTLPVEFYICLTLRAAGSAANFMGNGRLMGRPIVSQSGADLVQTDGMALIPQGTPAVGSNFDATATQQIDLFGTFSLNNANAVQLQQYRVESLN